MLAVVNSILQELNYAYIKRFAFKVDKTEFTVHWFISETFASQSYLVCSIMESDFLQIRSDDFFPQLASVYRKDELYQPDYDKNTSLIFCTEITTGKSDFYNKQIDIEDNPYYFKKYVFCYTPDQESKFQQLKKSSSNENYLDFIRDYVADIDLYSEFKRNPANQEMYSLISNLMIKIPSIPMKVTSVETLDSIDTFYVPTKSDQHDVLLDRIINCILNEKDAADVMADKIVTIWEAGDN